LDAAVSTLGSRVQDDTKALWDGWEEKGLRAGGWGLGAGGWGLGGEGCGPFTKWREDCQARPCSSILCPPFCITYRGRSKVSMEEAGWTGDLSLFLSIALSSLFT